MKVKILTFSLAASYRLALRFLKLSQAKRCDLRNLKNMYSLENILATICLQVNFCKNAFFMLIYMLF
jgi:hypothetical protein